MSDPSSPEASHPEMSRGTSRPRGLPLLPLLLLVLALSDLRTELLLLFDHLTFTSLVTALTTHPLAVVVLIAQPSLWRRYRLARR